MTEQATMMALEEFLETHRGNLTPMAEEALEKAITALRQALADAEARNCKNCIIDKPCVCKGKDFQPCGAFISKQDKQTRSDALDRKAENARELGLDYEPDNKSSLFDNGVYVGSHIGKEVEHTSLDHQPWVGLTDEEIQDALEAEFLGDDAKRNWQDDLRVSRAIEAALRSKNNG